MSAMQRSNGYGGLLGLVVMGLFGAYITLAAVQGDYGIFARVAISAEARLLMAERDQLQVELAAMENLTRRLSDDFLDLDLLDQQARDILGYMRPDEIAIR